MRRPEGPLPEASEGVVGLARRGRSLGLRAAQIRVLEWAKVELSGAT